MPTLKIICTTVLASLAVSMVTAGASADRTVLGPNGDTMAPESFRIETAVDPNSRVQNRTWISYSTPQGIELEAERLDVTSQRKKGYAFNIQYPLLYSLSSAIPAVSVGVKDVTGTGVDHGAFYIAATKSIPISDRIHALIRELRIEGGAGTGRIGGLFVGGDVVFPGGLRLQAELYKRRPNVTVTIPLSRHLDARAYSLDNRFYYGLSFSVRR